MKVRRLAPALAISVLTTLTPAVAVAAPNSAGADAGPGAGAGALQTRTAQAATGAAAGLSAWRPCGADTPADFRCATLKVPLDYRKPDGGKIDIAVSRIRTADPAKRRGVLLLNPGGPGGEGLGLPVAFRPELPKAVLDRYDLIGFDPRGIGRSTPLGCGLTETESMWPTPYTARTFPADVARSRETAAKCRTAHGAALKHFTTRNTARDMDRIRAALGERAISYLGYSYGTYLGAVYTQMFPRRADRMVLDSAVDPKLAWRETFRKWAPEAESAFRRWTAWAAERDARYGFGATPAAVTDTFWDLVAHADRTPIDLGAGRTLNGDGVRDEMRGLFFQATDAADALGLLRDAAAGKPVPPLPEEPPPSDNEASSQFAVLCGDAAWPRSPGTYARDSARGAERHPLYGDFASNITPCAFWDRPVEPPTKVDNRVGALILQNEWDSQTPLSTALGMRRALKGARMVTVDEGEGHGVYLYGNACADAVATEYLTTGRLPARDTTCAATPGPRVAPFAPRGDAF
ncbi:alpha/beta hydrolase [Streptomyces sp. NPDC020875]|uniref:alpha/beta hydrolase n=1 Tax=Streptomyces sp. NPDC020875 TaxID=3154898 RepID=UPI0034109E60